MVELAGIIQKRRTNITAGQEQIPPRKEYLQAVAEEIHTADPQDHPAATLR
jgi:hypothetical protein